MKEFTFLKDYQNNDLCRSAFNQLAVKTFDLSFEPWYQAGYWRDKYIPYTLFDGNKAIANISVNIMLFHAFGEPKKYIQLGTVMTDENHRNNGLSRFLMEKVLGDWSNYGDFIYLFANSSVLGFYPKFGFAAVNEYQYFKKVKSTAGKKTIQLNMDKQESRNKLYNYVNNARINGSLSMRESADLVMFYCISVLKDNVFYIPSLDVISIVKYEDTEMLVYDIFSKQDMNLDETIDSLSNGSVKSVVLGFVPKDCSSYEIMKVDQSEKDEVLFVQNNKTSFFDENQVMFPLLSHA